MPYVGQPFKRIQNEQNVEYIHCSALKLVGTYVKDGKTVPDWTAILSGGFDTDERIYATKAIGHSGWEPVPVEECDQKWGPGYAALKAENAVLNNTVAWLERRLGALEGLEERLAESMNASNAEVWERLRATKSAAEEKQQPPPPDEKPVDPPKPGGRQRTAQAPA
jgi:hypothetical protein